MSKRDLIFAGIFAALLACLTGGPLLVDGAVLGNFGDVYAYHHPLRHAVAGGLQEGRLPLWNPWIFCGTPLAANPQAALYMPLSAVFYFFPAMTAFDATWVLYLALAFLGAQLLARRWGLPPAAAFAAAAGFALHPFLVYRVAQGIPTHLASLAFVPWVWLAVERVNGSRLGLGPKATDEHLGPQTQSQPQPLLFLVLVLSLQALSGHPQFMVINLAGLALYLTLRRPRALIPLGIALAGTALVTAAQWIPTAEFLARSVRAHWTPLYATAYSLEPKFLWNLLSPGHLGTPLQAGYPGLPSVFFELSGLYPGLVALALAAWGLSSGRRALGLWALAAAGLFLALGEYNPLMRRLLEHPGMGSLRVPARWFLLALWALWMAGCAGWKRARLGPFLTASLCGLLLFDLGSWSRRFLYAQDPGPYLATRAETLDRLRSTPHQRYGTHPDLPNPNKGMLYRLPNVAGYEAFYLAGAALYASRAQDRPAADGSHIYIEDPAAFRDVGLRWYLGPEGPREMQGARALVYEEGGRAAAITESSPERIRFKTAGPAPGPKKWIIVAQAYYPGWKAWVDGVRTGIHEHAGFLQRLEAAGSASVTLRFDPELWMLALWVSVLSVVAATAWTLHSYSI